MKGVLLLLGLLLLSLLMTVHAEDQPKKGTNKFQDAELTEEIDDEDTVIDDEEDNSAELTREEKEAAEKLAVKENPCIGKECRRGEMCIVDPKRYRAKCICIPKCITPEPDDNRYQVCSKRNVTYQSECELDRDHCLCRRRQDQCSMPGIGKIRLDYYGGCQEITDCNKREFKEFPGRMREWLYIVMRQLAQRAEIPDYLEMVEEARKEANHSHAVIWKFCDLDVDPHDRFVSRRELLYMIQSLKALEHCLLPFLDECDQNSDEKITLKEWGQCLGLKEKDIKDECKNIRRAAGRITK